MNKLLSLLVIMSLAIGCTGDSEPIDPTLLNSDANGGGTGGGTGGGAGGGTGGGGGMGTAIFQADIDGVQYTAVDVEASINADGLVIESDNGLEQLGFIIPNVAVGSFTITDDLQTSEATMVYAPDMTETTGFLADMGSITVTEINTIDSTVSGIFNGNLVEFFGSAPDVVVTNGTFTDIPYTADANPDELLAQVDGVDFDADTFVIAEVNGNIAAGCVDNPGRTITVYFPANIDVGVYTMGTLGDDYYATYEDDNVNDNNPWPSVPMVGSIQVDSRTNNVIEGTLAFTAQEPGGPGVFSISMGDFTFDLN